MRRITISIALFWGAASIGHAAYGQSADHPVISEVRFFEHKEVNEEFVELHNPTSRTFGLASWKLVYKKKTGGEWRLKVEFGPGHSIPPHGYFLWGGDKASNPPDLVVASRYSINFSSTDGHVALRDSSDRVIDLVAWGGGDSPEGNGVTGPFIEGGSVERKANALSTSQSMSPQGGDEYSGNGYDTQNNRADFVPHNHFSETSPQNTNSAREPEWAEPSGSGLCGVCPCAVSVLDTLSLRFIIRSENMSSLSDLRIRIPDGWNWAFQPEDVGLEGACFQNSEISISGDTVHISEMALTGQDSGVVTLRSMVAPAKSDSSVFPVLTSQAGGGPVPIRRFPTVFIRMGAIPMILIHRNDTQGIPSAPFGIGARVMVSGTVTAGFGTFTSNQAFVQDATAGIPFYSASPAVQLAAGDSVTIEGAIEQFRGMTEISPDWTALAVHSRNRPLPEPKEMTCSQVNRSFLSDGSEPDEGRLIRIRQAEYDSESGLLSDVSGAAKLFIESTEGISVPSGVFDVTGILKQYKPGADTPPYTSDYEIVPRFQSDLVPLNGPQFTEQPGIEEIRPTETTIVWETDQKSVSSVFFSTDGVHFTTLMDTLPGITHRVLLRDLVPGTIYRYSIEIRNENGKNRSDERLFITASDPSSTGEMHAYFKGSVETDLSSGIPAFGDQDLIGRLVTRIDSARFSVDMCFLKMDENRVRDALIDAKIRGVDIRFICDDENFDKRVLRDLRNSGIPMISDRYGANDGSGSMHNKFAVFDHRDASSFSDDWVWTGSFNLTYWGENPPAIENVIVIQDQALAEVYTVEFEEMWGSSGETPSEDDARFGILKKDNIPHTIMIAGKKVEVYMSPSDHAMEQVIQTVRSADSSAYFCMFSFTNNDIAKEMQARSQAVAGFRLRGVMDAEQVEADGSSSEWSYLSTFGDVPQDNESGLLHHKYLIVDADFPRGDPLVATGSYNWTNKAEYENDENCLIVHDALIANQYLQEFAARYRNAGGTAEFMTGLEEKPGTPLPLAMELFPNYPNPFNSETVIRYRIPGNRSVQLAVYDLQGREVRTLFRGNPDAGIRAVHWDGRDGEGLPLPSGVYVIRMQAGTEWKTRKALLLR
jgi:phosphatidylserine/phosphatidylglycerophosphate/cardiolipin synthase-like enzyme